MIQIKRRRLEAGGKHERLFQCLSPGEAAVATNENDPAFFNILAYKFCTFCGTDRFFGAGDRNAAEIVQPFRIYRYYLADK